MLRVGGRFGVGVPGGSDLPVPVSGDVQFSWGEPPEPHGSACVAGEVGGVRVGGVRSLGHQQHVPLADPSTRSSLSAEETQDQQEAPHALHHISAPGAGEEVQAEAVPVHRRAGRVLLLAHPDRDPGQDLVPEPPSQGQEAPGGRAGETQDGRRRQDSGSGGGGWSFTPRLHVTAVAGWSASVRTLVLGLSPPPPQTHAAHLTSGPVHRPSGLQHVPPVITWKYISKDSQQQTQRMWLRFHISV